MDFLPVNTSQNQRLQYTQSYMLPQDIHIPEGPSHFDEQNHINGYAPSQNNHTGMLPQSKAEHNSSKVNQSVGKVHQEIDDYIKRHSQNINDDYANKVADKSIYSKHPNNDLIHENKPVLLESIVKNINLYDSEPARKTVPPMVATNDNMELPVIKQSDFDGLGSSNALEPLGEVFESRRHSTVVPLHRRLQQSSVNINFESQVRNYAPPGEQAQSLLVLEGVTQSLNNEIKARQLPRNLQRYIIRPIAQHEMENIGEPKANENNQPRQQIIIIPQILSNSGHRASSKQPVKRNLIQVVPQSAINHNSVVQQPPSERNLNPIEISYQLNESFKGKDSFSLKRNLQLSQKLSNYSQQIFIDPQQSGQLQLHSNGIPLQRSFVIERPQGPQSIIIEAENHQTSLNNSMLIKQRRELQQRKFDQSIPIELEHFLNEDMKNPQLTGSLKRKLQFLIPPPSIQVQIQQQNHYILNESLRSSLRRQLDPQEAEVPVNIEIEQQDHYINSGILKSSIRRQLEAPASQPPIAVQIFPQNQYLMSQSMRSSIRRQLSAQAPPPSVHVPIPSENEHFINQSFKRSLRRQLQPQAPSPPLYVQIPLQNEQVLHESLKSSLRRKLEARALPPSVYVQIPYEDEHLINQSLSSSLRRKLQSQAPFPPLYVQIPLQNQHILHESLNSSLRRNIQPQEQSPPVTVHIPMQDEHVLQEKIKSSLRRKLQSQAPPAPLYVQIPFQDYNVLQESLKKSLKRKLQSQAPSHPVSVNIPLQNQHVLQESLKSSLRRKLQPQAQPPSIYAQIPQQNQHFLQQSLKSSLRRKLQSQAPSPPVSVNIPMQNEHYLQQSLKSSLRRKLQPQAQPPPIYIQIPLQDYHVLHESLKSSLRRKLEAQAPLPPVDIFIGQDNERFMLDGSKSSLRRNLQAVQQPDPILVRLQQNQHSLYQSQRSTLKRKMVPPSHEEAISVNLGPLKEYYLQESLKSSLKRKLEPLPHEKLFKNEVQPTIQVELNETNQQSLQEKHKSSLRRKLDAPVLHRQMEIQDSINHNEILQDVTDPLNDSIHLSDLSERLETIPAPKNIAMQKRDLKLNQQLPQPYPQLPVNLKEVSQQVIDSSSNRIIEEPVQMKKSVHLNYDPCEQDIKNSALLMSKRSLKAEPLIDKSQKSCEEGWNPTKNIFNLFKIPATTKNTSQISFKKHRINTASLLH